MGFSNWVTKLNGAVARSPVGHYFRLEGSGHVSINPSHLIDPSGQQN